ncbi:asparagine synthase (glutamine-hydrolyzing) [Serpentinicella alkaliphila]|uniref:asparagine synthase (glutamine-hydrolyzing) n=1 Tax=Serpentinicella alkaliphila TaxID=1734049 RepID=A0A4R2TBC1_9FIRM|nr:asparagine synthase (glutamine-hydrolyzing) [Serpentinicella alkaliphila]QUH25495.1 asparagine synthase (glutamine-hydrolyzing) [Serpentinicella alkaliphila]TCP99675.1 asparagine synthase (glutamine-hydrolysing) [Serpentinicella alkaliphila]
MCGIVGWVNLEDNIGSKKLIIENMTNTLIKRGPDSFGYFTNNNILFGHRRLVVVDPEGGLQPMTRYLGESAYTIIYNGELYNTEDIREKLIIRGHSFKSYSDTEVLLTSYMEWGIDCVDHLNGIYAFAIWDEKRRRLFMARDRLGVKPLFYIKKGNDFIFASEIKALLTHPDIETNVDEEGLLEVFGLGPARTPGNGVFKDIKEVEPGYWLIYDKQGMKIQRYWQLESKEHKENFAQTTDRLREILVNAIERQLVSDVPVCTFLSGGLDSSAITAIVANKLKRDGKGVLDTYSVDYVDNERYFKPSEFQPNDDRSYIKLMNDAVGSNHRNIVLNMEDLVKALEDSVKSSDLPGMADVDSSLYLFCKEVRKNATVALSGECADEIFGGYPWFKKPEYLMSYTFPWSQSTVERQSILSKEFSKIPVLDYVTEKYEQTLREVPRLDGESFEQNRRREMFYLNMKWFMITLLNRKDRMSMANSLEVRVPFADHDLVEYAWNIPWEMKYFNGQEKGILRKALEGILPEKVVKRKKSPYPKTHNPIYTEGVQKWMREILADKGSPILQLIDIQKVTDIVDSAGKSFGKPWYGQLMTGPQLIAYLIQINIWLKEYKVNIV